VARHRSRKEAESRVEDENEEEDENEARNQRRGQRVGLLRMLKKYGTGWQTRTVRAQRS